MDEIPHYLGADDNITLSRGLAPSGDVIFLPAVADAREGVDILRILHSFGLNRSIIPSDVALKEGYSLVQTEGRRFCFIATKGMNREPVPLAENLKNALVDKRLAEASSLWIPLMGLVEGDLSLEHIRQLFVDALTTTGWTSRQDARVTIAFPPDKLIHLEDLNDLHLDAAVGAALEFAATLSLAYVSDGSISTTLLFLSLATSQRRAAPDLLRVDVAASLFAETVRSLAGPRFLEVWNEYFRADRRPAKNVDRDWPIWPTPNVLDILRHAAKRSSDAIDVPSVSLGDLIAALISFPEGRHRNCMGKMGIPAQVLFDEFADAVAGQIGKKLFNDIASVDDKLGYESYADAISKFLIDPATLPPLSISIQAPWGVGKSSLMHQIRERLDPRIERVITDDSRLSVGGALAFLNRKRKIQRPKGKPGRLWTVWFNAWKYDSSEQVWAGLVDAIVSEISNRLSPVDRELFLFKLQLSRIDDGVVRRKIYERIFARWFGSIWKWAVGGLATMFAWLGVHEVVANALVHPQWLSVVGVVPLAGGGIALSFYAMRNYRVAVETTKSEPASFSLAEYLQVPDYSHSVGAIHQIHHDLSRVLALVPTHLGQDKAPPIVVFIDDLDRCSPTKVASVVEGVSMFLADDDYRCMFVIGMDPQVIAAALEEEHSKIRARLPTFEATVPLGWRFMDKVIQLPFTIPPTRSENFGSYVDWLTTIEPLPKKREPIQESGEPTEAGRLAAPKAGGQPAGAGIVGFEPKAAQGTSIGNAAEVSENSQKVVQEAVEKFRESRDVGALIKLAAPYAAANPRGMKRLANLARFYLGLRNARRSRQPEWQSPAVEQYARWVILTLKWPELMRWLLWGADEGIWTDDQGSVELIERRLQVLEKEAVKADTKEFWSDAVKQTLGLKIEGFSDWSSDQRLFEFFLAESRLGEEARLSAAIACEFW
jgi:hypothetical protein